MFLCRIPSISYHICRCNVVVLIKSRAKRTCSAKKKLSFIRNDITVSFYDVMCVRWVLCTVAGRGVGRGDDTTLPREMFTCLEKIELKKFLYIDSETFNWSAKRCSWRRSLLNIHREIDITAEEANSTNSLGSVDNLIFVIFF